MNYHDWEPFCVEPLTPNLGESVTLRLRTSATSGLCFLERYGEVERLEMKPVKGGLEITLPMHASPLRYCFFLLKEKVFIGSGGETATLPRYDRFFHLLASPSVPDWAVGAVFFQIFPDRFRNGNPDNDPQKGEWIYQGKPIVKKSWDEPVDPDTGPLQHYGGDLEGILASLDYLQELGVEALYLTPIFPSPSNHRYDAYDYLNIDEHLGGNQAFQKLVNALHARGMRLVLDGVFNHIGNHHADFQRALGDPTSPEASMFTFHPDGSYAAFFGVKTLPKLDYASPLAQERFISGPRSPVRHWLQKGADGWRLDVAHQIGEGGTDRRNLDLLRLLHRTSREENPEAFVFGELFFDTVPTLRAHTLDSSMHYAGFANPLMEWLCGMNVYGQPVKVNVEGAWKTLWDHYASLPMQTRQAMYTLISSHDIPRALWRLKGDIEKFKLALGILLTFPGAPGIYYGDEIGLSQTNAYDDFKGDPMCRATMPWDQTQWNPNVRAWVKKLIGLRKTTPALRRGGLQPLAAPQGVLAFTRVYQKEEIRVFAAPEKVTLRLPRVIDLLAQKEVQGDLSFTGLGVFEVLGKNI
ncbi:MAG: glycoside hydrolase family 13 protein [Deinococcus sp.]|nr:glycoside hydrolase family 13 protein [Deinococcus sp.]